VLVLSHTEMCGMFVKLAYVQCGLDAVYQKQYPAQCVRCAFDLYYWIQGLDISPVGVIMASRAKGYAILKTIIPTTLSGLNVVGMDRLDGQMFAANQTAPIPVKKLPAERTFL